jgi:hypothetical protein
MSFNENIFPVNKLLSHLNNFSLESNEYYKNNSTKEMKEKQIDLLYKSVWKIQKEIKKGKAECIDKSVIDFSYSYSKAIINEEVFERYCETFSDIEHFMPSIFLSSYFKQNIEENTIIYELHENEHLLSNIPIKLLLLDKLFHFLRKYIT